MYVPYIFTVILLFCTFNPANQTHPEPQNELFRIFLDQDKAQYSEAGG